MSLILASVRIIRSIWINLYAGGGPTPHCCLRTLQVSTTVGLGSVGCFGGVESIEDWVLMPVMAVRIVVFDAMSEVNQADAAVAEYQ